MKRLLWLGIATLTLTLGTGTAAFAAGPANPPPGTDAFPPGKACEHANLTANRGFDANHETGVDGGGTPPTCGGGGA
ncbi:MAG: hypothetical protein QOH08_2047 [Chloroflexota bacterium]|jgi:hypothetical protein|nr:hypothetical protein [Chloroflexota bacterium]